jgi:predicted DNA-binding protein (MmcQ/YjbR family)
VTEDVKWGEHLVWSVGGKMFAMLTEDENGKLGLPLAFKCSEEEFDRLTEMPGIIPAPYAARHMWVSVRERTALSQAETQRLIGESYRLVLEKLPRRVRGEIEGTK